MRKPRCEQLQFWRAIQACWLRVLVRDRRADIPVCRFTGLLARCSRPATKSRPNRQAGKPAPLIGKSLFLQPMQAIARPRMPFGRVVIARAEADAVFAVL